MGSYRILCTEWNAAALFFLSGLQEVQDYGVYQSV